MSYLTAIAKTRHEILMDNERPRDILISVNLKHAIREECRLPAYEFELRAEKLMGMNVEWTKATALTKPQIVIRTDKGDTRIVSMLDTGATPNRSDK
jgi:hypothetical protein